MERNGGAVQPDDPGGVPVWPPANAGRRPGRFNRLCCDWLLWYNGERYHHALKAPPLGHLIQRHGLSHLAWTYTAVPVWRLWEGLDALMRAGRLRGVELDLVHPACPCFLLDVAPGLPRLYVELFLDDFPADTRSMIRRRSGGLCWCW